MNKAPTKRKTAKTLLQREIERGAGMNRATLIKATAQCEARRQVALEYATDPHAQGTQRIDTQEGRDWRDMMVMFNREVKANGELTDRERDSSRDAYVVELNLQHARQKRMQGTNTTIEKGVASRAQSRAIYESLVGQNWTDHPKIYNRIYVEINGCSADAYKRDPKAKKQIRSLSAIREDVKDMKR
jgi:hypothetical protein